MKHLLTIVGARPQFVKAAAISHVISEMYADQLREDLLHTGQHYDDAMSAVFFRQLGIPAPRHNLGVGSGPHGAQTAAMLRGIEEVLLAGGYDAVLVYGDTNSTLAGALAAAKLGVPLMHVEAGLRSNNRRMPEELNRVLTDHASTLLFAPTPTAVGNLAAEGIGADRVVQSGDVMLDCVRRFAPDAEGLRPDDTEQVLLTVHRNLNTDDEQRLKAILSGVEAAARLLGVRVLFPVHPRTAQRLGNVTFERIRTCPPLSYFETLATLRRVGLVMTDSGGLQKEAHFCGRPCVVLRDETEWAELVGCGAAMLAGADAECITTCAHALYGTATPPCAAFGDGHAAERIISSALNWLNQHA